MTILIIKYFKIRFCLLVLLSASLVSCVHLDPYENFKGHMQNEIGESIDNAPSYTWRYQPKSVAPLPNGNIAYKYEHKNFRGTCRYIFEADPATRTIVKWAYDGEDKDKACFVNP